MRSKWNSLFFKMMLMFFALILPLYGLSVWLTNNSSGQMLGEIERSNESVLLFHYSALQFELDKISGLLVEYSVDGELADFSTIAPVMSNYDIDRRLNDILLKLGQMKASSTYMQDVRYYLPLLNKVVSVEDGVSDCRPEEWRGFVENRTNASGTVTEYEGGYDLVKSSPNVLAPDTEPNFLLVVRLSEAELAKQLRSIRKEGDGGSFLLFGRGSEPIASDEALRDKLGVYDAPEADKETDGQIVRTETDQDYYYSVADSADQFRLVSYISKRILFEPIRRYSFWMRCLTVVSCALIVVFTYGLYRLIHRPLFNLIRGFRRLERGDMTTPIELRRGDEFGYLYNQFNQTLRRLHTLIEDNFMQRIRTQDAELKHLQSQIAPHFLYNSLFTIKQMAELENTEAIKQFSDYLGQYFRFVTRDFSKEVPLGEELDHSLVYLHIQEMRFSNRIKVEAEPLPERYRAIMVPRIILQPILENIFNHGLVQQAAKGRLRLSHRIEGDRLILGFEDNGNKLTDERLRELQERLEKVSSLSAEGETTGLMNVHHRLIMKFGPEYGLALSRSPLGGLGTEVRLPIHNQAKD